MKTVIGNISISVTLICTIALSLYHNSYEGFLGLTVVGWNIVWSIAVNFITLSLIVFAMTKAERFERLFLGWVFIPYFIVKFIYDISAYGQIHIFKQNLWNFAWDVLLVDLFLSGLVFSLIMFKKWQQKMA